VQPLDGETARQTDSAPQPGPMRPRVVVIDDLPLVREFVAQQLRQEGFQVAEAAGGLEGIRRLCEDPADLVLADLQMPACSERDVARAARQLYPNLPVVLVTGNPEMAGAALEATPALRALVRAVIIIPKPVHAETLLQVVRTLTEPLEVEKRPRWTSGEATDASGHHG
jgi:CheY-like chemotaxis protein